VLVNAGPPPIAAPYLAGVRYFLLTAHCPPALFFAILASKSVENATVRAAATYKTEARPGFDDRSNFLTVDLRD
jgi:hypothetical protein